MNETLSDRLVAALPDQFSEHERTEKMPPEASERVTDEPGSNNVEARPESNSLAVMARTVDRDASASSQPEVRTTLIKGVEPIRGDELARTDVLHVGCGAYEPEKLPLMFRSGDWREVRLDIDPDVKPDVVASITDMQVIPKAAVDAVYSSHNVEHLYPHEVPFALNEMNRVLKPNGFAFIKLPDLQEVARFVAEGKLEDPLYLSSMGAISPLDILYGHRPSLARGNTFMAHRTGFTDATLASALITAGFAAVMMQRDLPNFSLTAIAFRTQPDAGQVAIWRARLLPAAERPTVLYARNG